MFRAAEANARAKGEDGSTSSIAYRLYQSPIITASQQVSPCIPTVHNIGISWESQAVLGPSIPTINYGIDLGVCDRRYCWSLSAAHVAICVCDAEMDDLAHTHGTPLTTYDTRASIRNEAVGPYGGWLINFQFRVKPGLTLINHSSLFTTSPQPPSLPFLFTIHERTLTLSLSRRQCKETSEVATDTTYRARLSVLHDPRSHICTTRRQLD